MVNNTSLDNVDIDEVVREIMIFSYIRSIFNKITKSINKSTNIISYRCLNKLNNFIKVQTEKLVKTKINMIKIITVITAMHRMLAKRRDRELQTRIKEHRNKKLDQFKYSVI